MATQLENLTARRDAICAELAALDDTEPGGRPNVSGPGQVDHVGYKDGLYRELERLRALIDMLEGPSEQVMRGYT